MSGRCGPAAVDDDEAAVDDDDVVVESLPLACNGVLFERQFRGGAGDEAVVVFVRITTLS